MFNFLEKFGFRDGRPGLVPKMLQEEVAPPEWAREHLQAAKKAEQNSKDSNDRISGEKLLKGEDVVQLKEGAQNEEKVNSEKRPVRLDNQKAEGATDGRPDSDMYWVSKNYYYVINDDDHLGIHPPCNSSGCYVPNEPEGWVVLLM